MKIPAGPIRYSDSLNDEFSGIERKKIDIDKNYDYEHSDPIWKIGEFIVYRVIAIPVTFLYMKISLGTKIYGRNKVRNLKKKGYYLYGNHTHIPGDGIIPTMITFPKRSYVITNPDNIALKGTGTIMEMLGAIPTPTCFEGYKNFLKILKKRIDGKKSITVYPEAHIWPYYTGVRPFTDVSFRYPASDGSPVFSFSVLYRKGMFGKPKMSVYIDGPFYSDKGSIRERQAELRNKVYDAIGKRTSSEDNYRFVEYKKVEGTSK